MDSATRHIIASRLRDLTTAGTSLRAACAQMHVPVATGKLWLDKLAAGGDLTDARAHRSGRRPICPLTDAEAAALRSLVIAKSGSEEAAIRAFRSHPACTEATRLFITRRLAASHTGHRTEATKERWPDSIRRAIHITRGDLARARGPLAKSKASLKAIRNLDIIWPDGHRRQARPHTLWMFDDYSTNQPFYLEYTAGQFRLCRQILAGYDVFTGGFLSFFHVGREKDAYTGGDALRAIHLTIEAHGTRPELLILERGRWESNAIRGVEIAPGRRWGALSDCGIIVHHTWDSNGKAELEGFFRVLQVELEGGADIGNTRGLHERESKNYMAVNRGGKTATGHAIHPRDRGFISLTESEENHYKTAALLHARRRDRRELGYASADELFAEFPHTPRPLDPAHRWLFLPHKQLATVGSIGPDLVGCKVDGRQYLFVVNGVADGIHLDNGHRVAIAFDPDRPHMGCAVGNADTSTANRDAHRLGALLLGGTSPLAMPWETQPRIDLRTADEKDLTADAHWQQRKSAHAAAEASFRAIMPDGQRGLRVAAARTRDGNLADIPSAPEPSADIAAAISDFYSGTGPGQPHHSHSNDSETAISRAPENSPPAASADSPRTARGLSAPSPDLPSHPRLKSPPAVLVRHAADDDDIDALEAAAMAAAGLTLV
jgi:hypothetical protein